MQNHNKTKSKETINSICSDLKVNKYLSSGQMKELETLRKYKSDNIKMVWECQDDWMQ